MKQLRPWNILGIAAGVLVAGNALATPNPTGAIFIERIFNDCPFSTVTTVNAYPGGLTLLEEGLSCGGFANLHVWRFSEDGTTSAVFNNNSAFSFSVELTLTGTVEGEAGIQIAPWWGEADGRLNVRTSDGEIACFGGRLPFYSFTGNHGIHYIKGMPISLEMTYLPNGLSAADPATISYLVGFDGQVYQSGPLQFDMGNPAEDPPYGLWGMLNDGKVGGHVQPFLQAGNPNATFQAVWKDIKYDNLKPVSVDDTSWGRVKNLYKN